MATKTTSSLPEVVLSRPTLDPVRASVVGAMTLDEADRLVEELSKPKSKAKAPEAKIEAVKKPSVLARLADSVKTLGPITGPAKVVMESAPALVEGLNNSIVAKAGGAMADAGIRAVSAPGAGTARAMGSLMDKPGSPDAVAEFVKGAAEAARPGGEIALPTEEYRKRTGQELPGGMLADMAFDVSNLAGTGLLKAGLPAVAVAKGAAKAAGKKAAEEAAGGVLREVAQLPRELAPLQTKWILDADRSAGEQLASAISSNPELKAAQTERLRAALGDEFTVYRGGDVEAPGPRSVTIDPQMSGFYASLEGASSPRIREYRVKAEDVLFPGEFTHGELVVDTSKLLPVRDLGADETRRLVDESKAALTGQRGAINPVLAAQVGGGALGAAVGAQQNPEHPILGALGGAVGGAALGHVGARGAKILSDVGENAAVREGVEDLTEGPYGMRMRRYKGAGDINETVTQYEDRLRRAEEAKLKIQQIDEDLKGLSPDDAEYNSLLEEKGRLTNIARDLQKPGDLIEGERVRSGIVKDPSKEWKSVDAWRVKRYLARQTGLADDQRAWLLEEFRKNDHFTEHRRTGFGTDAQIAAARDKVPEIRLANGRVLVGDEAIMHAFPGMILNAEDNRAFANHALGMINRAQDEIDELTNVHTISDPAELQRLAEKYGTKYQAGAPFMTELKLKLAEAYQKSLLAQKAMMGIRSEFGRGLESLKRIQVAAQSGDQAFMEKAIKAGGMPDQIAEAMMTMKGNRLEQYRFLRGLARPNGQAYWRWYYLNSLLSGPLTQIRNAVGNASKLAVDAAATTMAAVTPGSHVRSGEALAQFPGMWEGIKKGLHTGLFAFKNGFSVQDVATWETRAPEVFKGNLALNSVSRAMEGMDQFFQTVAFHTELYKKTYTDLYNTGLRGEKLWDEFAKRVVDPDEATMEAASRYAKQATYRHGMDDKTWMSGFTGLMTRGRNYLDEGGVRLAENLSKIPVTKTIFNPEGTKAQRFAYNAAQVPFGTFIMPFISTPINVLRAGMEYMPGVGQAKAAIDAATGKATKRAASQTAQRAALGTLLTGLAAMYAAEGKITGAPPRDKKEREQFYADGKKPMSVLIGDQWVSYQAISPLALPLATVANTVETLKSGADPLSAAAKILFATGNNIINQSYLSGIQGLLEAFADDYRGEQWMGRTLSSFVPASGAVRTVRTAIDPYLRDPDTVGEHITANIPGASYSVKPRQTATGQDVQRLESDEPFSLGAIANRTINPFPASKATPDKARAELMEIGPEAYYPDLSASKAQMRTSVRKLLSRSEKADPRFANALRSAGLVDDKLNLSDPVLTEYGTKLGQAMEQETKWLLSQKAFRGMSDNERLKVIGQMKNRVRERVRSEFISDLLSRAGVR